MKNRASQPWKINAPEKIGDQRSQNSKSSARNHKTSSRKCFCNSLLGFDRHADPARRLLQGSPAKSKLATNGTTTTFEHPQSETLLSGLTGFYQWSPNLTDWYAGDGEDGPPGGPTVTISAVTAETTTTVTATASEALETLFLNSGVMQN